MYHATQYSVQFNTYELFVNGIFYFIFLDCNCPQGTETTESETADKGELRYAPFLLDLSHTHLTHLAAGPTGDAAGRPPGLGVPASCVKMDSESNSSLHSPQIHMFLHVRWCGCVKQGKKGPGDEQTMSSSQLLVILSS